MMLALVELFLSTFKFIMSGNAAVVAPGDPSEMRFGLWMSVGNTFSADIFTVSD